MHGCVVLLANPPSNAAQLEQLSDDRHQRNKKISRRFALGAPHTPWSRKSAKSTATKEFYDKQSCLNFHYAVLMGSSLLESDDCGTQSSLHRDIAVKIELVCVSWYPHR
eukprot:769285-Amphidinium_carterae.1